MIQNNIATICASRLGRGGIASHECKVRSLFRKNSGFHIQSNNTLLNHNCPNI